MILFCRTGRGMGHGRPSLTAVQIIVNTHNINKGGKFLKRLKCCVSEGYCKIIWF